MLMVRVNLTRFEISASKNLQYNEILLLLTAFEYACFDMVMFWYDVFSIFFLNKNKRLSSTKFHKTATSLDRNRVLSYSSL